jgi:aminoglycoside 3-N-acetyltransferase I
VEVARLNPDDAEYFRDMLAVFAAGFNEDETYLGNQPDDHYIKARLADPNFIALVAKDAVGVFGALTGYVLHKFEQARSELYIYDLAVLESHRRQGIATALIERTQEIARDIGAYVIIIQADYGDVPATTLYSKLGQRESVLHFDISPKE